MWIAERGQEQDFPLLVDPNSTALIVIDVQNDFCHPDGAFGRVGHDNSRMPSLSAALHKLLAAARAREVFTVFVRATYDREVTSRPLAQHRRRLRLVESLCLEGTWGAEWYDNVGPSDAPNEVVLTKHRFDAFQGTPLDLYLRSNGIKTVVVTGVVTSGCVESTVRDAFFLDYSVVVPRDGVAEAAQAHHDAAIEVMRRSFATITDVDAIVAAWRGSNAPIAPSWKAEQRASRALAGWDAAGFVLVDEHGLTDAQRSNAEALASAAEQNDVPIFRVRTIDSPLGCGLFGQTSARHVPFRSNPKSSPREMWVDKMRRSAFADTRLGLLLRTNGIAHVALAGADRLPGSLLATALDGLDRDYAVSLISDAASLAGDSMAQTGIRQVSSAEIIARWQLQAANRASASLRSNDPAVGGPASS